MTDTADTPDLINYTVLADAITIDTGVVNPITKRTDVIRAVKNDTFDSPPDHPAVLTHLGLKAIRPTKDVTGKERITTRRIMELFRSAETGPDVEDVVAIDAPHPVEDPNDALV